MISRIPNALAMGALVTGCASIDFNAKTGLTYYEPKPYFFVSVTDQCVSTASVVSIPSTPKQIKFNSGYGSSALTAEFSNGIITGVGQTTDTKVPETITSLAALATSTTQSETSGNATSPCEPSAVLYPIVEGVPDVDKPINFLRADSNRE